jgi:hypothetical protein
MSSHGLVPVQFNIVNYIVRYVFRQLPWSPSCEGGWAWGRSRSLASVFGGCDTLLDSDLLKRTFLKQFQ